MISFEAVERDTSIWKSYSLCWCIVVFTDNHCLKQKNKYWSFLVFALHTYTSNSLSSTAVFYFPLHFIAAVVVVADFMRVKKMLFAAAVAIHVKCEIAIKKKSYETEKLRIRRSRSRSTRLATVCLCIVLYSSHTLDHWQFAKALPKNKKMLTTHGMW